MGSPLRSLASWLLAALACLLTVVAIGATWMHHQLLNTEAYADASVKVLRVHSVQNLTAAFLADQLVAQQSTQAGIAQALPPALRGLATTRLHDVAEKAAREALRAGALEAVWRTASERTHLQFVRWLDGRSSGNGNGDVELDLQPAIEIVARRVGISDDLIAAEAAASGGATISIVRRGQYAASRADARRLGQAATLMVPLTLVVALVSIAVAPRRRWGIMRIGLAGAAAGGVVLIARDTVRTRLIEGLVDGGAARPVAHAIWNATSPSLVHVGWYAVIAGAAVAAAAFATGVGQTSGRRSTGRSIGSPG
jgi:hypothetical protein